MKLSQRIKKLSQSLKLLRQNVDIAQKCADLLVANNKLRRRNELLEYGNKALKQTNIGLLAQNDTQYKRDLNEAINVIIDYQKTVYRLRSPDPNIQRANDLLNRYGVKSQRVNDLFKVFVDGADSAEITMGREY